MGIVIDPVAITLATADPVTVPNIAEDSAQTFAGPPKVRPAIHVAIFMNTSVAPVDKSNAPRST